MRVFRTFGQSRMHPKVCSDTDTSAAAAPDATPAASAIMSRIGLNMGTLLTLSAGSVGSRDAESSRSEEHTSELQSRLHLVCRLLLEKKKKILTIYTIISSIK